MPLISSLSAGVRAFGLYVLSALVTVIDTFNRSDNASDLGSAGGQKWKIWRGVWQILTNKAYSATTPSSNVLATLTFTKTDVTVSVSGAEPGLGASFWVTDADNWYASVYTRTQVCQTCTNCNAWNTGTCNSWTVGTCNSWNTGNCANTDIGNCTRFGQFCCLWTNGPCASNAAGTCAANAAGTCAANNPSNCNRFNNVAPKGFCQPGAWNTSTCARWNNVNPCSRWNNVNPCLSWNTICNGNCCNGPFANWGWHCIGWNTQNCAFANPDTCTGGVNPSFCNSFFSFSCNCVTEHRMRIFRSLAGTISDISNNLYSLAIQSFKILLSGNQATVQAFSTTTYTSEIGNSQITTITSPVKTKRHGIIKSSSNFEQGSSIDEFGVS